MALPTPALEQLESDSLKYSDIPKVINRYNDKGTISLTERGVFKLACMGWSSTDIAALHGCNKETLAALFSDALREGRWTIASRLRQHLLYHIFNADKPDPTLFRLALKNMAGFTEEGKNLDTGEENKPSQLSVTLRVLKKTEQSG